MSRNPVAHRVVQRCPSNWSTTMSWTPFFLKRIGEAGRDNPRHLFCVGAKGNPELVRTGESDAEVLINGASGPDVRESVQRLVDALNDCWEAYLTGTLGVTVETLLIGTRVRFLDDRAWDGLKVGDEIKGKEAIIQSVYLDRREPVYTVLLNGRLIEVKAHHVEVL